MILSKKHYLCIISNIKGVAKMSTLELQFTVLDRVKNLNVNNETTGKLLESLLNILNLVPDISKKDKTTRKKGNVNTDNNVAKSKDIQRDRDLEFVREFLSTPYDNPMTADEAKRMICESL